MRGKTMSLVRSKLEECLNQATPFSGEENETPGDYTEFRQQMFKSLIRSKREKDLERKHEYLNKKRDKKESDSNID